MANTSSGSDDCGPVSLGHQSLGLLGSVLCLVPIAQLRSATKKMQATEALQCMVILKLRGTGWSLLFTCQFLCGTSMISSGGVWTIHR